MRLQRQAQRLVIRHHLLANGHHRQGKDPLRPLILGLAKERQIRCVAQPLRIPERLPPVHPERAKSIPLGQPADHRRRQPAALLQVFQAGVGCLAPFHHPQDRLLPQPADLPQAQPHGPSILTRFQRTVPIGKVHIRRTHLHPMLPRIPHDLGRRIKAHGL